MALPDETAVRPACRWRNAKRRQSASAAPEVAPTLDHVTASYCISFSRMMRAYTGRSFPAEEAAVEPRAQQLKRVIVDCLHWMPCDLPVTSLRISRARRSRGLCSTTEGSSRTIARLLAEIGGSGVGQRDGRPQRGRRTPARARIASPRCRRTPRSDSQRLVARKHIARKRHAGDFARSLSNDCTTERDCQPGTRLRVAPERAAQEG